MNKENKKEIKAEQNEMQDANNNNRLQPNYTNRSKY